MKRKPYGEGTVILHLRRAIVEIDKLANRQGKNLWKWRHYIQLIQEVRTMIYKVQL